MTTKTRIPKANISVALKKYATCTLITTTDAMEIFDCSRSTAVKLKHLLPAESVAGTYMDTIAAFRAWNLDVDTMKRQARYSVG